MLKPDRGLWTGWRRRWPHGSCTSSSLTEGWPSQTASSAVWRRVLDSTFVTSPTALLQLSKHQFYTISIKLLKTFGNTNSTPPPHTHTHFNWVCLILIDGSDKRLCLVSSDLIVCFLISMSGKGEEQRAAASLACLLCIQLGSGIESEEVLKTLKPIFKTILADGSANIQARQAVSSGFVSEIISGGEIGSFLFFSL